MSHYNSSLSLKLDAGSNKIFIGMPIISFSSFLVAANDRALSSFSNGHVTSIIVALLLSVITKSGRLLPGAPGTTLSTVCVPRLIAFVSLCSTLSCLLVMEGIFG